jgi:hypothetical protein
MQMFFGAFLNQLLGMIDNLTIVTHFFLVSLAIPANISSFLSTLFPLITLDYLQVGLINEEIFKFSELDISSLNYQFESVGYT